MEILAAVAQVGEYMRGPDRTIEEFFFRLALKLVPSTFSSYRPSFIRVVILISLLPKRSSFQSPFAPHCHHPDRCMCLGILCTSMRVSHYTVSSPVRC